MKKLSLLQMRANQKGKISEIAGGKALADKLNGMGVYKGKEVTLLSHFVFKGPVAIKVGRSVLALGYGMANKIMVETE